MIRLTARLAGGGGDPLRVIVVQQRPAAPGSEGDQSRFASGTLLATTGAAAPEKLSALRAKGVRIAVSSRQGKVDLHALMRKLGEMEIASLLVRAAALSITACCRPAWSTNYTCSWRPLIFGGRNNPTAGGEG